MLNEKNISNTITPLVRERSKVQSFPAAPESPMKSGISDNAENTLTTFRDATEREHAPSRRAGSVRDVHEAFEDWADRQVFEPEDAQRVDQTIRFLRLAAVGSLAPEQMKMLMEHVAALSIRLSAAPCSNKQSLVTERENVAGRPEKAVQALQ